MIDLTDDLDAGYGALTDAVGAVVIRRDAVVVRGPDAVTYLQGQLSQDIDRIAEGTSAWSLLLQPQGKVESWVRVTGLADGVMIDVDGGHGEAMIARLRRFLLRVKVEFVPWAGADGNTVIAVRGPGSSAIAGELRAAGEGAGVVAESHWPGLDGFDLFVGDADSPENSGAMTDALATLAPRVGLDAYDAVRIERGVPAMGAELMPGQTIPAEAGQWLIDASVSFTKGCYTGQELVARIDSRGGNVPKRLRGIIIDAGRDALPAVGSSVVVDGETAGTLTSVAWSPGWDRAVALAYIGRKIDSTVAAILASPAGECPARIEDLPLARSAD